MSTNQQFDRIRRLASQLAGIELSERHRELLARRSGRLDIHDGDGFDALLGDVESGDPAAVQKFLCLLTTKFTGFFRHPRHFEMAAEHAWRVAPDRGRARLWSAAAATGEEPWSLAMALVEKFGCENPPASVLATDVDAAAIATARRGQYSEPALLALSSDRRQRFFYDSSIVSSLRQLVEFRLLNLADVVWQIEGPFDVIFCRNVMMYFEASHRYAVLERMASLLAPGGLLFIDPTEHLGNAGHWFDSKADGVYLRRAVASVPKRGLRRDFIASSR